MTSLPSSWSAATAAAAPAPAPTLEYAVDPFQSWGTERSAWIFMVAACISNLFADGTTIPLLVLALPGLYLATVVGGKFSFHKFATFLLCLAVTRGISAADYFSPGISWWMAYATATAIAIPLCGVVLAAGLVQKSIWSMAQSFEGQTMAQRAWLLSSFDAHVLVFPTLCTALFQILSSISPIGEVGNPAFSVVSTLTTPSLVQFASVFGEMGLVFWVTWMGSVGVGYMVHRRSRSTSLRSVSMFGVVTALILVGGAWKSNMVERYQQDITEWPLSRATSLQVSCLTAKRNTTQETMIARTNERLAAGDDLILWSEGAGQDRPLPSVFDWPMAHNPGAVVAVTFLENVTDVEWHNSVQLLQANSTLWRYDKNRPVPVVEPHMVAGEEPPSSRSVTFTPRLEDGQRTNVTFQVATAICFDFDFPYLLRPHAHDADLVIGPSEYWGSLGQPLWTDNVIRAIENGFTLMKCAANGISGAVDPHGRTMVAFPTVAGSSFVSTIPVAPGISTVYANYGGYLFGWACVVLTPFWILLACWPGLFQKATTRHGVEGTDTQAQAAYTSLESVALNRDDDADDNEDRESENDDNQRDGGVGNN